MSEIPRYYPEDHVADVIHLPLSRPEQEPVQLEAFPTRFVLEGLGKAALRDLITECGLKVTKLEKLMHEANEVLDGYGGDAA